MSALTMLDVQVTGEEIADALKKGATGGFGDIYGELSVLDMCIWVRKHIATLGYRPKKN